MAAITVVDCHPVTPVGYEVVDKCELLVDVVAGDLLTFTGSMSAVSTKQPIMTKAPTTGITEAHGIALMDGYAGQRGFSVGIQGEMDGFSGMTPGAPMYPSVTTAGKHDTTIITGAIVRMRSITDTKARYSFV